MTIDKKLFLGGDINIDLLQLCHNRATLLSTVESNSYTLLGNTTTRVTPCTESLLDVFIRNMSTESVISGALCSGISDHFPIYMLARTSVKHEMQHAKPKVTTQKITAETLHAFLSMLVKDRRLG